MSIIQFIHLVRKPFNFSLNIKFPECDEISIPYSQHQTQEHQTQGPSVNYLADLMSAIVNNNTFTQIIPSVSNILKIGDHIAKECIEDGFLLDIKRTGDHEQALGTKIAEINQGYNNIFCSIDHLSTLFARLINKNSIFHVNDNITLYRFKTFSDPNDPQAKEFTLTRFRFKILHVEIQKKI